MSVAKYTVYVLNCIPFDFLSVTFVFRFVDSLMLKAWRQRSGNAPLVLRVRVPGRPKLPVYLISKQPFRAIVCFVLIWAPHNLPVALIFAVLSLSHCVSIYISYYIHLFKYSCCDWIFVPIFVPYHVEISLSPFWPAIALAPVFS